MRRKILTIEDFVKMCQVNKIQKFNSSESGFELALQVPASIQFAESQRDEHEGLLKIKTRILHTGRVYNGFVITKESVEKARKSAHNRPILANIHQLDDGSWDFQEHDCIVSTDSNGNEELEYIEKQVGSITDDETWFEFDEAQQKEFWCAYAVIPREYTKAAEILESKNGTKVSSEIYVRSMSWNAEENVPQFDDWYLSGLTLLGSWDDGTEIAEGIKGSRADISSFSVKNNSVVDKLSDNSELIKAIKELSENLKSLNINNTTGNGQKGENEGQMNKFEELLKRFNKTVEDVTFDYAGLSDEELEAKFIEYFTDDTTGNEQNDGTAEPDKDASGDKGDSGDGDSSVNKDSSSDDNTNSNENPTSKEPPSDGDDAKKKHEFTVTFTDGTIKNFSLSLNDIESALYNLVNSAYGETDNAWYLVDVYPDDSKVVFYDIYTNMAYRQSYERNDASFSLIGERARVKQIWATDDEISQIENMKSNYSSIQEQLENFKKKEILSSNKYASIMEFDEVKELLDEKNKESFATMTADELTNKLNEIIVNSVTSGKFNFSGKNQNDVSHAINLPFSRNGGVDTKSPYGDLFKKYRNN